MRDPNNPCLFCNPNESGIAQENELAYASYDTYPVSDHHCLIIPKRHVVDYFELSNEEVIACNDLIKTIKEKILKAIDKLKNKITAKEKKLSKINIKIAGLEKKVAEKKAKKLAKKNAKQSPASINN